MYVPSRYDLFYAPMVKVDRVPIHPFTGETRSIRNEAYDTVVLQCKGVDDRAVLAQVVWPTQNQRELVVLLRENHKFFPVGPEIVEALGRPLEPEPVPTMPDSLAQALAQALVGISQTRRP